MEERGEIEEPEGTNTLNVFGPKGSALTALGGAAGARAVLVVGAVGM